MQQVPSAEECSVTGTLRIKVMKKIMQVVMVIRMKKIVT